MKRLLLGVACAALSVQIVGAEDTLRAAQDLYTSASYEEALRMLTGLRDGSTPDKVVEQVDQYRAFCLFALGRNDEAQKVAEGLISKNPMLQLDGDDASPGITAMFSDVRRTLLPTLVRERYKIARTALDSGDMARAEPEFTQTKAMLEEADRLKLADPALSDLRLLVDGFLALTRSSQASAAKAIVQPATPEPAKVAQATPAAPGASPASEQIYDITTQGVSIPVAIVQNGPIVPQSLIRFMQNSPPTVMADVLIDERGEVERVTIRNSQYQVFDDLIVQAVRGWKYQPARKDGTPVKFLKTIAITLRKPTS